MDEGAVLHKDISKNVVFSRISRRGGGGGGACPRLSKTYIDRIYER